MGRQQLQWKNTLIFVGILTLLSTSAWAKRFANEYTEFELPPGWECALEGSEWVCQSVNEARKKEAIIILVAKIRGEQDSLDEYLAYLKKAKTYSLPGGRTQISEPKYADVKTINDHRWVDSLHLASEVPGFYTRYLATVKEDLGVAVTFSVSKDHYSSYQAVFDSVIATLRVFRQKKVDLAKYKLKSQDDNILDSSLVQDEDGEFKANGGGGDAGKDKKKKGGNDMVLFGGIGAALVVAFLFMKKKKK